MELKHIPLDQLKITAVNMRHERKAPDVSDLLPTVRRHGILQPLLVRPNCDGRFEVVAGRRRYFAAQAIAAEDGATSRPRPSPRKTAPPRNCPAR